MQIKTEGERPSRWQVPQERNGPFPDSTDQRVVPSFGNSHSFLLNSLALNLILSGHYNKSTIFLENMSQPKSNKENLRMG